MRDSLVDLLTSGHTRGKARPPVFQHLGPRGRAASSHLPQRSAWIWKAQKCMFRRQRLQSVNIKTARNHD